MAVDGTTDGLDRIELGIHGECHDRCAGNGLALSQGIALRLRAAAGDVAILKSLNASR